MAMITYANPTALYDIAETLRECVHAEIVKTGPDVIRSCVVTGEIAWDDCECGQLIVALEQSFPSAVFPNPGPGAGGQSKCGLPLVVGSLQVSMLRCSPPGDNGPPTCEQLAAVARQSIIDAHAVNVGVHCCLTNWHDDRLISDFQIDASQFVGGEGLCQGSLTAVQVGIVNACPPCDDNGQS